MSAEEIFQRFASSILFLTCDESVDESSQASGVLVSADGFILTNAHVVEKCRSMTATHISGASRQSYEPLLKYYDEKSDVAVLKISGQSLDFLSVLARPVRIGERVYAIGNPRGLEQSISEGIVSGDRKEGGTSWIQHSAPISPGSSGGALISSRGELLGINSRAGRDSQNLNFAVPAAMLVAALVAARTRPGILVFPPSADAQLSLGRAYQKGRGVPRDYVQAAAWYRKAAEQGESLAQDNLGRAYMDGRGVPQDYVQAAAWYRKAAEQGETAAQIHLGFAYANGKGVPRDYSESYFWIDLAAKPASELLPAQRSDLAKRLDAIATHLTAAELSRVQERARDWLAARATKAQ
jgi:Trypsin-like peptidase domain/Sel1 repeat